MKFLISARAGQSKGAPRDRVLADSWQKIPWLIPLRYARPATGIERNQIFHLRLSTSNDQRSFADLCEKDRHTELLSCGTNKVIFALYYSEEL